MYCGQREWSCLGIEFEKALTNGGELNFDKSSLHFNVKKKYTQKLLSI